MVSTLEVYDETQTYEEPESEFAEDEDIDGVDADTQDESEMTDETSQEQQPAELTQDETIEAYKRKEQVLRDAQNDLTTLEDECAALRKEVNGFKKPISDARCKVERLISCDIVGFLQWEKEQNPPTLFDSQAWRELPVEKLDVTEKDKEKLLEHFVRCGDVADWLCLDFPPKKAGLNGEKTKERLRDAINKISGVDKQIEENTEEENW